MATVTKSLSSDFGGNLDSGQLVQEIIDNGTFIAVIQNINVNGDVVDIVFDQALDGPETTTLNSLIGIHVPIANLKSVNIGLSEVNSIETEYTNIFTYVFPGSDFTRDIQKISIVSRMDSGLTSYSVRVVDFTNAKELAAGTFSNTTDTINNLTITLANISVNEAIWSIEIKVTGGSGEKCYIKTLQYFTK